MNSEYNALPAASVTGTTVSAKNKLVKEIARCPIFKGFMIHLLPIFVNLYSSVQLLSHVQLFETPWTTACQASLSITNSWSLPKLMSFKLVMSSNHLILCRLLLFLPPIYVCVNIWYLFFSFWLTSLCVIGSRFIPSLGLTQMCSFYGWVIFCCIHAPQLLYPFVDGYLGCFHVPAIVNGAGMDTRAHASLSIIVFSGYMPSSGIVGSYGSIPSFLKGSPFLDFWRN